MTDLDVLIVGGGVVGTTIARALAERGGRRVLLVEQARVGRLGATSRSGALVRQQHTAHCAVPLAVEGLRWFAEADRRLGASSFFHRTGFAMVVGPAHFADLDANIAAVDAVGGQARRLEPAEFNRLYSGMAVPEQAAVGYEPDAGYVDLVEATEFTAAAARAAGADLAEGVRVERVLTAGDRVTGVHTNLGPITARQVILCAGAWTARLLADLDPRPPALETRRIGLAQASAEPAEAHIPIGISDLAGTYYRPGPRHGLSFGVRLEPGTEPDAEPAPVSRADALDAAERLSQEIPALKTAQITGSRVGFDAYTQDRHPVIGPFGPDGLYLCTGFSGGGAKLAPAVGVLAAGEVATGEPADLLAPYRPGRFAAGAPVESDHPYDYS